MPKAQSFGVYFALVVGVVVGMLADRILEESPSQAQAAAARPTLDTLQTQINKIISGEIEVGAADHATSAVQALTANSANSANQAQQVPLSGITGGLEEYVEDVVGGVIVGGQGINTNYNDAANLFIISSGLIAN